MAENAGNEIQIIVKEHEIFAAMRDYVKNQYEWDLKEAVLKRDEFGKYTCVMKVVVPLKGTREKTEVSSSPVEKSVEKQIDLDVG